MDTTPEHPHPQEAQEPAIMKSMTLGMVGDLGRLLQEHNLGRKVIKIIEALIFGMFLVTEAFVSARQGLDQAKAHLDRFHEDMIEYIFAEYFFKHQKAKDMQEVEARFQQFNELLNQRYQEYREDFTEDHQDPQRGFSQTFAGLFGHLFPEPLPEGAEQDSLRNDFAAKMPYFWSGCVGSLQPPTA